MIRCIEYEERLRELDILLEILWEIYSSATIYQLRTVMSEQIKVDVLNRRYIIVCQFKVAEVNMDKAIWECHYRNEEREMVKKSIARLMLCKDGLRVYYSNNKDIPNWIIKGKYGLNFTKYSIIREDDNNYIMHKREDTLTTIIIKHEVEKNKIKYIEDGENHIDYHCGYLVIGNKE